MTPQATAARDIRWPLVDAMRGLAMVWMTWFHFSFDLNHFGLWVQDFYTTGVWTYQRTAIVSLFLWCAGMGQAIATEQGQSWSRFWRRWAQVGGAALLVSAGSWWMFPRTFIYFGVLHGMAVMLLLLRAAAPWAQRHLLGAWVVGVVLLAAPPLWATTVGSWPGAETFNQPVLNWLGLITRKPVTQDYVPLLPWLGVMLWGFVATCWLLRHRPAMLARSVPGAISALSALGRWSLSFYLLHQPVMLGALAAWVWWSGR